MTARLLACLLLAAPILGGCLSDRTFGEALDDSSAATEVKTRLLSAGLNGRFMEVDVAVVDRFVLLSGRVASQEDRKEAERILEDKTQDLFQSNQNLRQLASELDLMIKSQGGSLSI